MDGASLFIDGSLSLPFIMDTFNTDIFGGSQGEDIQFQPLVVLPLATDMDVRSRCF